MSICMIHATTADCFRPDMVPIIRCPRGNAAEMVARRLDAKLRDHIASTSSRNARDAYSVDALQRPRKFHTPFMHSSG